MDGAWRAWQKWVRNVVSHIPGTDQTQTLPRPQLLSPERVPLKRVKTAPGEDLKAATKPVNRAELRRDLTRLRRPRPKFEKLREREQLKRINPKLTNLKVPPKTYEEKLVRRVDPPKPFDIDEQYLETPKERKGRMEREETALEKKKKVPARFAQPHMSKWRRHLLYLNPGTQKLLETHQAFVKGTDLPKWTRYLVGHDLLTYDEKNLYFEGKPLATDEVKRKGFVF